MNLHSTLIRRVDFRTRDRRRLVTFYEDVLGLRETRADGRCSLLAGPNGEELLQIEEDPRATVPGRPATGLYHVAFLLPSRRELARVAETLLDMAWDLRGFVDHGVSESLYLEDPDGNGLELTWDRDFSEWPRVDGKPSMRTRGLSLRVLLESQDATRPATVEPQVPLVIGHVHLSMSDLGTAESLFVERLGLEQSTQDLPGALFFTTGEYHHYFAVNRWQGPAGTDWPARQLGWVGLQLSAELAGGVYLPRSELTDS